MTDIIGQTLKGMTKSVFIDQDAITISYRAMFHGFKGDKRIPYSNITSVQFMEPGSWLAGYIQFSIKGALEWQGPVVQDENAIQFDKQADEFRALRDLVQAKMIAAMTGAGGGSLADEIAKLAALREQGILTDEEFAAQKAKLLR